MKMFYFPFLVFKESITTGNVFIVFQGANTQMDPDNPPLFLGRDTAEALHHGYILPGL